MSEAQDSPGRRISNFEFRNSKFEFFVVKTMQSFLSASFTFHWILMSRNWKQQQWKVCDNNGSKLRDEMKIEWQDLPLLGYGYFAKVVFKCWTKNIANWSGCWYVASNIWYFFSHEEWPRFGWENECVVQIVGIHEEKGQKSSPPLPSTPSG